MVNYTLHNTMFLCHLYRRTTHKRILAKLAFAIDYGYSLGRAKMWSSGHGQVKTCWHLCHAAAASWWTGLFKSLPLDDVSWRKNVLKLMCQLSFVSRSSPFHVIYISLVFNFADQATCFRWQASIFQL